MSEPQVSSEAKVVFFGFLGLLVYFWFGHFESAFTLTECPNHSVFFSSVYEELCCMTIPEKQFGVDEKDNSTIKKVKSVRLHITDKCMSHLTGPTNICTFMMSQNTSTHAASPDIFIVAGKFCYFKITMMNAVCLLGH